MTGGRGLDNFREENINDKHFTLIHDYENDQEIFPNTDIGGGIMYFLWDKNHNGQLDYYMHNNDSIIKTKRFLNTGDSIIIRDYNSSVIVKKSHSEDSFMKLVSSQKPFGLRADIIRTKPEYFSNIKTREKEVKFFAWDGMPTIKFISKENLKNLDNVEKWKVFLSKTADPPIRFGRENNEILRKPFLGEPNNACSETYIMIGPFDNDYEAKTCLKYIKTKFLRFLVLQKKKTQNVSKDVFEFVPLQDFTDKSDIDWSKSISEIDQQLYKKYNLTEDEINFIESKIKPME